MDPCSLSNLEYFTAKHLEWNIIPNFETRILSCVATQKFQCVKDGSDVLVLDSNNLDVNGVMVNGAVALYKILDEVKPFGQPLEIKLPSESCSKGSEFSVHITYKTSPQATAVQWLKPEQTLDKRHPYLFTQCQAIHARSLLPCQDSPGKKISYSSQITIHNEMVALMSAVKGENVSLENGNVICHFKQEIPIPSYLLAIVIGALESRKVGPRSRVWCEPSMVEKCAYEFEEVEQMLKAGESLLGPYVWTQYDLLILPPSFPYGGMENPCLTFITPTVIAGDKSLTSIVAHEITHSWTGNLVTNKTWEHFWLNEGFTRFVEGKIVGILNDEPMRQFMAIGGWQKLQDTIDVFGADNQLTALQPVLRGIDPDDAFSSVPYEKGYAFLYYIESLVGGQKVFNGFLKSYIETFHSKAIVTDDFKEYLFEYFSDTLDKLKPINWDAWLNSPGMPPVDVIDMYDDSLASACKILADRWTNASVDDLDSFKPEDFRGFITLQKIDFLTKLYQQQEKQLSLEYTMKMADVYDLQSYENSEIKFGFLRLSIRVEWTEMLDEVVKFVLAQGRMKFVRPLYREMYNCDLSKDLAIKTFQENRYIYHSITANMVAKDLNLN